MRFKIDENLGRWLAEMLSAAGHDAASVHEQGLAGKSDHDVIAACTSEPRCLVTMDVEFGNPVLFDPRRYAGIVVLRVPDPVSMPVLRATGETLIGALDTARRLGGLRRKLWIVQPGRVREYQHHDELPPGFED